MVRLEEILEKVAAYAPNADLEVVRKAYVFSGVVHQGQIRQSGEPYLSHPLEVANILAGLKMDVQSVATGLLHDTVEDTHTTIEKIAELFGDEVASLVDGLTKLSKITFEKKADHEAENFRKMILAMGRDIRVIVIKLADRLHNMRTLGSLGPVKQKKIARETMDIYAPLANRLGMGWMKTELEDLAFMYLEPEKYNGLREKLSKALDIKENFVETVKAEIEEKLREHGIEGEVTGRPKHLYSIYKKMRDQDVDIERIYDILAFRVIVRNLKDCYGVLGLVHSTWKPVPGRFKDFIAIPKLNMYQSLHTTVVGPFGMRMEIQIRTEEMHRVAEYGIAAHWKYKEGKEGESKDEKSFAWLRQLLEFQMDLKDSEEFMDSLKVGLFPEEVFVFTPKGDIKQFPTGATPIDFAYSIHSDIGNACYGAKVNGKMAPLRYKLSNGDIVEIITAANHHPSKDWLKFVVTSRARARVRAWIKTEERVKSVALGKEILEKEISRHNLEPGKFMRTDDLDKIAAGFGVQGAESLLASIGYGKLSVRQVIGKVLPPEKLKEKEKFSFKKVFDKFKGGGEKDRNAIMVMGVEDVMVRFAKCCNPLPGDDIDGFITHGQGVSVHAAGCPNLLHIDRDRRIEVAWDTKLKTTRPVNIQVVCRNEKGLLAEMTNAIMTADANISSADIRTSPDDKDRAICTFEVEVADLGHLKAIITAIKKIKKVIKVERLKELTKDLEAEGIS